MDALEFTIRFHGPFRSATGKPARGHDIAVDLRHPLPGSHIKGLMRDAATTVFGDSDPLVGEVFGSPRAASPWSWSGARFDPPPVVATRARIAISDDTHTVEEGALISGEELWADGTARFAIRRMAWLEPDRLDLHRMMLSAAARATHHVGKDRRRGLGWVSIVPAEENAALIEQAVERACTD